MVKNITLSLPDEIGKVMAEFPEVNWSAVARDAIESYVHLRQKPDLSPLIDKLRKERGEEYVKGVESAKMFIKTMGYAPLSSVIREYKARVEAKEEEIAHMYGVDIREVSLPDEDANEAMAGALKKLRVLESSDLSEAFLEGLRKTLLEMDKELKLMK